MTLARPARARGSDGCCASAWRRCAAARPRSCRRTGRRPTSSGWRTSSRGASRASSGGGIRFRRGMDRTARCSSPRPKTKLSARRSAITSSRRSSRRSRAVRWRSIRRSATASSPAMKTCSTPGSRRRCGRSPRWAGRRRPPSSKSSTRQRFWSPDTTSCSSGWPEWSCSAPSSPGTTPSPTVALGGRRYRSPTSSCTA